MHATSQFILMDRLFPTPQKSYSATSLEAHCARLWGNSSLCLRGLDLELKTPLGERTPQGSLHTQIDFKKALLG